MDIIAVGRAIAYLRKRAGYTQKELADRIGISDKTVSKWERGQGMPEIGYLRKLSILLDTDSDSLLAGDVAHHKSDWRGVIVLNESMYGIGAGTMIYDKPLINYLLSYFILVGIKNIYVVCTASDADYIMTTLCDGSDYGISLTTVIGNLNNVLNRSQGIDGLSGSGNIMLVYGKCILYGVDQTRFFQKAMLDRKHLTILALPSKVQKPSIVMDVDKRVVNDTANKKKLRTQYDFSEVPIMFFPNSMLPQIVKASSIYAFIEEQKNTENIFVELLDRGFVDIEVDDWNDVQDAACFMRIVQEKCGMNVYCLEEVAWRRGMISLSKLKELGERKKGTEYGDYVLELYDRFSKRIMER